MADDESERLKAVIRARNIHVDKEADVEDAIDEWIRSVGASAFEDGRKFGLQNEARRALELCEKWRPLLDMKAVSAENYEAFLVDLRAISAEKAEAAS